MLIRTDEARTLNTDSWLACLLAAVAGALNTVAFEIVGFFAANMTGNVSSLSDNLARFRWNGGIFFLSIVLFFIFGALLSTLIINAGRRRGLRGIYAFVIVIEALALMVLGVAELSFTLPGAVLILALSLLMGLQNAVVTRISNARVRTTHVSGTATDIGIEMAMLIDILRRQESPSEATAYLDRLKLHALTIAGFLVGGIVGIWAWSLLGYAFLIVAGCVLMVMSLLSLHHAKARYSAAASGTLK
ncbi:YoaK family protein [Erwinia sp. HDF1-3R]|uniref:YoaK family protein n=1 Tax=Erwinia sp. HDF1-3R TaxID=3141543 RepID=UPI0031F56446